ncbi:MAG TPA: DUF5343 domain-containing protein [Candidatus Kapabacteria bacterium]|nr:DUF5343 domain-containing protein [Candidatus Kapabacteria bacterium]
MALPTTYTQASNLLGEFFNKIRDAQAPDKFVQQQLVDFGYKSKNHRAFIPLLKALGFITVDGVPTQRYHDYRNHALSKRVMGEALKTAYSDIFLIKAHPTVADRSLIEGKFKSYHNASDVVAGLMAKTFYALLDLADLTEDKTSPSGIITPKAVASESDDDEQNGINKLATVGLHYNIQIHLPATKDVEVYNAIFKSLKEHLLE